jgi:hypothetical protein
LSCKDVDASKLTLEEVQEMIAKKKHLLKVAAKAIPQRTKKKESR